MIALIIIGAVFLLLACYLWAKLIFVLIDKGYQFVFRKRIQEKNNPYIVEQKARMENTKNYHAYQKWMRKKGDGIPLEKVIARDEKEAIEKIKKYLYD